MDYELIKRNWKRLKANLTRARNSKDPDKVIAAVDAAEKWFETNSQVFPDAWPHWQSLRDSARMAKRHGVPFS